MSQVAHIATLRPGGISALDHDGRNAVTVSTESPKQPESEPGSSPANQKQQQQSPPANTLVLRISLPAQGIQKAIRATSTDTIWAVKLQVLEKIQQDIKDGLNHGLFMPGKEGRQGKFLEERRDVASYSIETNTMLEFIPKIRLGVNEDSGDGGSPTSSTKKKQKRLIEDVQKGAVDKIRERGRQVDPNFWAENQETPLSIAVMNNDKDMIGTLIEFGAFLDYRLGEKDTWKTPLHIAASHNKLDAMQSLLQFGSWMNVRDSVGLTPLWYAATAGHTECVFRLLLAKADTEVFDQNGKGPLHQACLNGHELVVAHLIDFGANINALNLAGNTPLHVAATRSNRECVRWLLIRGADREKTNRSGQTPAEVASISGNEELGDTIKKFTSDQIVPLPPKLTESQLNTMARDIKNYTFAPSPSGMTRSPSGATVGGNKLLSFMTNSVTNLEHASRTVHVKFTNASMADLQSISPSMRRLSGHASMEEDGDRSFTQSSPSIATLQQNRLTLRKSVRIATTPSKETAQRSPGSIKIPPPPQTPRPEIVQADSEGSTPDFLDDGDNPGTNLCRSKSASASVIRVPDSMPPSLGVTTQISAASMHNLSPSSSFYTSSTPSSSPGRPLQPKPEIKEAMPVAATDSKTFTVRPPSESAMSSNPTSQSGHNAKNLSTMSLTTHAPISSLQSVTTSSAALGSTASLTSGSTPAAAAVAHLRKVLSGISGSELDPLLKSLNSLEVTVKISTERAVRAEVRAKKLEEELSKLKKGAVGSPGYTSPNTTSGLKPQAATVKVASPTTPPT